MPQIKEYSIQGTVPDHEKALSSFFWGQNDPLGCSFRQALILFII